MATIRLVEFLNRMKYKHSKQTKTCPKKMLRQNDVIKFLVDGNYSIYGYTVVAFYVRSDGNIYDTFFRNIASLNDYNDQLIYIGNDENYGARFRAADSITRNNSVIWTRKNGGNKK